MRLEFGDCEKRSGILDSRNENTKSAKDTKKNLIVSNSCYMPSLVGVSYSAGSNRMNRMDRINRMKMGSCPASSR